jgi:hypothetical protein
MEKKCKKFRIEQLIRGLSNLLIAFVIKLEKLVLHIKLFFISQWKGSRLQSLACEGLSKPPRLGSML